MKLYELEKGTMFTFPNEQGRAPIKFDHIDGMHSVCYAGEHLVHIAAYTDVIPCPEYSKYDDTEYESPFVAG